VANHAGVGHWRAAAMLFRLGATNSMQEKAMTFRMQRMFRNLETARALLQAAPETHPYRNEAEVRKLFGRLAIPIKQFRTSGSCYVVEV